MRWRIPLVLITLIIASAILFVSILKTASTTPSFTQQPSISKSQIEKAKEQKMDMEKLITYKLVSPGSVLPDHPLWWLKALRDRVWLMITPDSSQKAELYLLFADKRLVSAIELFEREKYETGYSTLEKGEHYLKLASDLEKENRQKGYDTSDFLNNLANASLKHRYEIDKILIIAPEDAQPFITLSQNYSRDVYEDASNALLSLGLKPPFNPFNGEL